LFATFGITYRYAMWLQRPLTRMYGGAVGARSSARGFSCAPSVD